MAARYPDFPVRAGPSGIPEIVPIKNPDGSYSSERTIGVQDSRLNKGRETLIPTLIRGVQLTDKDAVKWAVNSNLDYPSFDSPKKATAFAKKRTGSGGASKHGFLGKARDMAAKSPKLPVRGKGGEGDTMIDRAMRTAKSRTLIPQPGPADRGATEPVGKTVTRTKRKKPARPAAPKSAKARVSAEALRDQSISQALMKGAAVVPQSSVSGTLRGLLTGAAVGLDLRSALASYQQRKRQETAAAAALKMNEAPVAAGTGTPFNVSLA